MLSMKEGKMSCWWIVSLLGVTRRVISSVPKSIVSRTLAAIQGDLLSKCVSTNLLSCIVFCSLLRNEGWAGGSYGRHQEAGQQNTFQIKEWVPFFLFLFFQCCNCWLFSRAVIKHFDTDPKVSTFVKTVKRGKNKLISYPINHFVTFQQLGF